MEKTLLQFTSESVLPMFFSKSFLVSGLPFRSFIHFEFIFEYGVRECSDFFLLHVAVQFSHYHLLKGLFSPLYILVFFVADSLTIRSDQISRSVVSDSLGPHESQHARPPCPSTTPGVHPDSRPSSQ